MTERVSARPCGSVKLLAEKQGEAECQPAGNMGQAIDPGFQRIEVSLTPDMKGCVSDTQRSDHIMAPSFEDALVPRVNLAIDTAGNVLRPGIAFRRFTHVCGDHAPLPMEPLE